MGKFFLWSTITTLLIAATYFGYNYYQKVKQPRMAAVYAIPHDAGFIIALENSVDARLKLSESSFWKKLLSQTSINKFQKQVNYLDSIFKTNDKVFEVFSKQTLFISAHSTGFNQYEFLYLLDIPHVDANEFIDNSVKRFIGDKIPITKRHFGSNYIIEFPVNNMGDPKTFSYTYSKGLFIGSFSPLLVENSLKILNNSLMQPDSVLLSAVSAAGNKVDANLYINYKHLYKILGCYSDINFLEPLTGISGFASYTELDVKLKSDGILLNGITPISSENNYLQVLKGQDAQQIRIPSILPMRTAQMFYWGFSNANKYFIDYENHIAKSPAKSEIYQNGAIRKRLQDEISKKIGGDVKQLMRDWIGNEMALVITEPIDSVIDNNIYAVFHTKNIATAKTALLDLVKRVDQSDSVSTVENYNGSDIFRINIDHILGTLYGTLFSRLKNTYFTITGEYVIFANHPVALQSFIDDNLEQRVLSREANYEKLTRKLSNKTNFFIFNNLERSVNIGKAFASDSTNSFFNRDGEYMSSLGIVGLQFTRNDDAQGFYSNGYLLSETSKSENSNAGLLWSVDLKDEAAIAPQFVVNHSNQTKEIIVQDKSKFLYLFNNTGEMLWKKEISGLIKGKITQVDFFKNGKLQYFFCTQEAMHLIDRDGNYMKPYPVRLPQALSNTPMVFDYEKQKDYRIVFACKNNQVYNYTLNGKPSSEWNFKKLSNEILRPIQFYKIGGKDYMIITDNKGYIYFSDRKGSIKTKLDNDFVASQNNIWMFDDTEQAHWLSTDEEGTVYLIYPNGNISSAFIDEMDKKHCFYFDDINNDKLKDYIFLDKNTLKAYNQDTSLIFSYTFPNGEETTRANFCKTISIKEGKKLLGVTNSSINKIFLFNPDGSIYKGFPVKGTTAFDVISAKNDESKQNSLLTVAWERKLMLYIVR